MKVCSPVTTVILLSSFFACSSIKNREFWSITNKKRSTVKTMPPLEPIPMPHETELPQTYARTHKDINNLLENNEEWVKRKLDENPNFFKKLGSEHKPQYFWIGCSDARVPNNEIIGEDAGSVFTVRNVANLVVGTDFNLQSALQYAVSVLNVPHIIVCGHYDCGGVRASHTNMDHIAPLENWVRHIRDIYRIHAKELNAIKDPEKRHRRLVEINVKEQCLNLFKSGAVQRHRVETYARNDLAFSTPRIHGVVFDPKTGYLKEVEINWKEEITALGGIYDLYSLDQ